MHTDDVVARWLVFYEGLHKGSSITQNQRDREEKDSHMDFETKLAVYKGYLRNSS